MCQALLDMREECISIGKEKGREEGISIGKEAGISIGRTEGISIGRADGIRLAKRIYQMRMAEKSEEEIASACGISVEEVREILA